MSTKTASGKNSDKLYFMNLEMEREKVFKNEEIPIIVKFFNRIRLVEASLEVPEGSNFFLKQVGEEVLSKKYKWGTVSGH